ncbi:MAG: ABC transporter substrate-binding protein [Nitrospinota bacterium]|nr:ABC transporter substrate-binding protein [Nitrospinota bacterium]
MKSIARRFSLMILVLTLIGYTAASSIAAESVRFALDWIPYGKHSGLFAGLSQGIYAKAGLDVKIQRGFGADTLKFLSGGKADFIIAETDQLIVRRSKGLIARTLGMFHDKSLFVIYSLKGAGIRGPKDLEGKTVGGTSYSMDRVIFPVFAKRVGITNDKVSWATMDHAALIPSLLSGKVKAMSTFHTVYAAVKRGAQKVNKQVTVLLYSDHGFDIYSGAVSAMDSLINKRPDYVRRFLNASYQALAWSIENPEKAVRGFVKTHPEASYEVALAEFQVFVDHILTPYAKKHGLGQISAEKMKTTRNVVTGFFKTPRIPEVSELYSNKFLPKLFPKRKKVDCKLCP